MCLYTTLSLYVLKSLVLHAGIISSTVKGIIIFPWCIYTPYTLELPLIYLYIYIIHIHSTHTHTHTHTHTYIYRERDRDRNRDRDRDRERDREREREREREIICNSFKEKNACMQLKFHAICNHQLYFLYYTYKINKRKTHFKK